MDQNVSIGYCSGGSRGLIPHSRYQALSVDFDDLLCVGHDRVVCGLPEASASAAIFSSDASNARGQARPSRADEGRAGEHSTPSSPSTSFRSATASSSAPVASPHRPRDLRVPLEGSGQREAGDRGQQHRVGEAVGQGEQRPERPAHPVDEADACCWRTPSPPWQAASANPLSRPAVRRLSPSHLEVLGDEAGAGEGDWGRPIPLAFLDTKASMAWVRGVHPDVRGEGRRHREAQLVVHEGDRRASGGRRASSSSRRAPCR
jgi:hypothetical protein